MSFFLCRRHSRYIPYNNGTIDKKNLVDVVPHYFYQVPACSSLLITDDVTITSSAQFHLNPPTDCRCQTLQFTHALDFMNTSQLISLTFNIFDAEQQIVCIAALAAWPEHGWLENSTHLRLLLLLRAVRCTRWVKPIQSSVKTHVLEQTHRSTPSLPWARTMQEVN